MLHAAAVQQRVADVLRPAEEPLRHLDGVRRAVAVHVAFESKGLGRETRFHFMGSRVETGRLQALWVTCVQLVRYE